MATTKHIGALTGVLLTMTVIPACDDPAPPAPDPSTAPSSSAHPALGAVAADPAARFTLPPDLCKIVEYDPFSDLFPAAMVPAATSTRNDGSSVSSARCLATAGGLDGYSMWATTDVFTKPTYAAAQFDGFKTLVFREHADAQDVEGIGEGAYAYTDPALGSKLVVWQGNLNLEVMLTSLGDTELPEDITERLTEFAAQVMTAMPRA